MKKAVNSLSVSTLASLMAIAAMVGFLIACGDPITDSQETTATTSSSAAAAPEPTAESGSDIAAGKATPTPTPEGDMPVYGGVLNFISCCSGAIPRGADPYHASREANFNQINYSSLVSIVYPFDPSKGIQYEGHLATEWRQQDDGSWVIKLREGVTWHDGEKFTADDVVATINRFVDEDVLTGRRTNEYRHVFSGAEKIDDYTVLIHTGGSPSTLAWTYISYADMVIVPDHLITGDLSSDDWEKRWNWIGPEGVGNTGTGRVGTGPFKETHWEGDHEWVSERASNYFMFDRWGQRLPYLAAFQMINTPDGTRRLARFASGAADLTIGKGAGLHPDRAKELCAGTKDKECYIMNFPHGYFNTVHNHLNTEAFLDPRVNAAGRYAQDMDQIAQLAYGGRQGFMVMDRSRFPDSALTVEEQYELIPWSVPERRDEFLQKGKDLMVEAGYADGIELPQPIFSNGLCGGSFLDQYSRQVDALTEVGILGFLECREGVVASDELKAGRFSINMPGSDTRVITPADGLIKFHLLDSAINGWACCWKYDGQETVDKFYRDAEKEMDDVIRAGIYKDAERFIADPKWTVYPSMYTEVFVAVHGCVRDYHPGGTWRSHNWSHMRTWMTADSECTKAHSAYLESKGYR